MLRRLLIVSVALGALWAAPAHASAWCGTATSENRVPELVGGSSVHVVYALPSDGADRLGLIANAIETDVENIDTWWRGQDPTRTPRFDRFAFACGPQADILTLRLTVGSAEIPTEDAAFARIAVELAQNRVTDFSHTALVYYDGPYSGPEHCGIGGGALGVVFTAACAGLQTDWTAAHELGHVLGAVQVGAPHRCPDSGHTCGDRTDLMNPYNYGEPLSAAILDPGRDDYYGHSGGWTDIQDSQYLEHLDSQQRLSLTIVGAGDVTSDVQGVACSVSCTTDWDGGAHVALTGNPGNGLRFVRWSGACTGDDCVLTIAGPTAVTAFFAPATFRLTATVTGKGSVRSSPAGLACKPRCRAAFTSYEPVRLTAKPAKGWRFRAWGGACKGKRLTCSVPMKAASGARAAFVKKTA